MYSHRLFLVLLAIAVILTGCSPFRLTSRFVEGKSVTNFTVVDEDIYFGAGYSLYKFNTTSGVIATIYQTNSAQVEQPLVADGVIYFGGQRAYSKYGWRGEKEGLFAYNLQERNLLWKFPLDKGYGSFGTFPFIGGDQILVCAREHLYSLDRKTGKELWDIENWMGSTGGTVNIPYVFDNRVYFMVEEERAASTQKTDENDGHWAEVNLDTGERAVFSIAEHPGTYKDSDGEGIGTLVDGVIYGNSRVDRFGALDLRAKKFLWEVSTDTLIKPVVQHSKIYLIRNDQIQALDQKTGKTVWTHPLDDFSNPIKNDSMDRFYEENYARRVASNERLLIVQGSLAIGVLDLNTGEEFWRKDWPSKSGSVTPTILGSNIFVLSANDCAIVQLELETGKEVSRTRIPDCSCYSYRDS